MRGEVEGGAGRGTPEMRPARPWGSGRGGLLPSSGPGPGRAPPMMLDGGCNRGRAHPLVQLRLQGKQKGPSCASARPPFVILIRGRATSL